MTRITTELGRKLRVYALTVAGGLFHLVLTYEATLPSSRQDLWNVELAYLVLKGFKQKLDATSKALCELGLKKARLMARGEQYDLERKSTKPNIINTPDCLGDNPSPPPAKGNLLTRSKDVCRSFFNILQLTMMYGLSHGLYTFCAISDRHWCAKNNDMKYSFFVHKISAI
jgi:hypothetical protein